MPQIYNMPSGVPFLRALALGLTDHFGDRLRDGLILLPTRRATRALAKAFVQQAYQEGRGATLLPRLRPLADVNPDEPPFEPGELAGRVRPAIDPVQRRFEIAQLVARYHERVSDLPLGPAAAVHMADPLISIMDDAALEDVRIQDQSEWAKICEQSAIHFQDAGRLYQIVETYWPERLQEIDMMEPNARRVALLKALADVWSEAPPDYPVVIAGSTGTLGATADLMKVVANLPDGMVVLPGLQDELPDAVWKRVDARHPQSSLKTLLSIMDIDRKEVRPWPWVGGLADVQRLKNRRRILAEALVPVDATGDWVGRIAALKDGANAHIFDEALEELSLLEARSDPEEALAIALILREALETPHRSAALVTPDQLLAQRVQTRLRRWGIDIAMSQGTPVEQTPIGVFLFAILGLAENPNSPAAMSQLLAHPLCCLGLAEGLAKQKWQVIECNEYRGLRRKSNASETEEIIALLNEALAPLQSLEANAIPDNWATALINVAETLARTDDQDGAFLAWRGEAGTQAAQSLDAIQQFGARIPETDVKGFADLLSTMLRKAIVRPEGSPHSRLSILGPLEARLLDADVIVLGGLNEGTWPAAVDVGPFLSRGMRKELGLSLPERRYGLAAHDFAELAANPVVYLTRSQKDDSGPTVASRWVWRLKTLLRGAMAADRVDTLLGQGQRFLDWARELDRVDRAVPAPRPNPTPPVEKRWARQGRQISITGVSQWIRDPYSLYGREVLRLKKLDPIGAPNDARHFGTAMHAGIEDYVKAVDDLGAAKNQPRLEAFFKEALLNAGYSEPDVFKESARISDLSENLVGWFESRSKRGFDVVGTEVEAAIMIEDLNFRLKGVLDLVERSPNGYAFTDFKTGKPASSKVIAAGFDLQLPLAGWLASQGAMDGLGQGTTEEMGYVRIKSSNNGFEHKSALQKGKEAKSADELIAQAIQVLRELIQRFDQPETGYASQPRAQYTNDYGDYDDLARRAEWMTAGPETDQ